MSDCGVHDQHREADTFSRFLELAYELRALIWDYALPPGTISITWDQEKMCLSLQRLRSAESMNIQLTCTEARTAWLYRHKEVRLTQPEETELYSSSSETVRMDIARDLLYFGQGQRAIQSMGASTSALLSNMLVTNVQNGHHHQHNRGHHINAAARCLLLQQAQQVAVSLSSDTTLLDLCNALARLPNLHTVIVILPLAYGHEDTDMTAGGGVGTGTDSALADSVLLNMLAHLARADHERSEDFASVVADVVAAEPDSRVSAAAKRYFGERPRPQIKYVKQMAGRRESADTVVTLKEWRERCVQQLY